MKREAGLPRDDRLFGKKQVRNNGKSDPCSEGLSACSQPPKRVKCPECTSQLLWKDGIRRTVNGDVQRWLCRRCGYRFSENNLAGSSERLQKTSRREINSASTYLFDRQIGDCRQGRSKNLAISGTRQEEAQREGTAQSADVKGRLVEFVWWMKKKGYKTSTINAYSRVMKFLAKKGNILDPDVIEEVIAEQTTWGINRKALVVDIYTTFLKFLGKTWEPPRYKHVKKLPFIPTESEIDQLIAACKRKLGIFLQTLKETGMRPGEAWALKWCDVDTERGTITVNDPEKGSNARILNITKQLAERFKLLPKSTEYVFRRNPNQLLTGFTSNFIHRRKAIANKLNNPRLLRISFKTFRHFKGTELYHKTKDILHVKETLGHRNIQNTLIYIHLEAAIFKTNSDEFTVRTARTIEEAKQLLEVGFEYVTDMENVKLFRKRK